MAMRLVASLIVVALFVSSDVQAQRKRAQPAKKPAPEALKTEPAKVSCPNELGQGVATKRTFCDVQTGTDPKGGVLVVVPPHRGATLLFDVHNRQLVSMELVEQGRAYTRATATIGVLTKDSTLLTRAVVQTEFRRVVDLFDRIAAGPGQPGVKALAPVGVEPVAVTIPEGVEAVSILGEKLVATRIDGTETITGPGRPIAVVSNVRVEYRPRSARR
jgi:glucose/arabinose dehydrogenase